jgi:hypothetical protein
MTSDILTESHAARLRAIARRYRPRMGKAWRHLTPNELWLRVLAQIVVAGNAAPADMLERSEAVKEKLAFPRLRKLSPRQRRQVIHSVLRAIGTRYVGEKSKNAKIDAALHNFDALEKAGGPVAFFKKVAAEKDTSAKLKFLEDKLHYYKKKGCRDTLIELRLASDCMALDQRIKNILEGVGVNSLVRLTDSTNKLKRNSASMSLSHCIFQADNLTEFSSRITATSWFVCDARKRQESNISRK